MKAYINPEMNIIVIEETDLLTVSPSSDTPGFGEDDMIFTFS